MECSSRRIRPGEVHGISGFQVEEEIRRLISAQSSTQGARQSKDKSKSEGIDSPGVGFILYVAEDTSFSGRYQWSALGVASQ